MLIPASCPICGAWGSAPCVRCRADLRPAAGLPPPAGVDRCLAVLDYHGAGRELIARLKYRNARASLGWLADRVAAVATAGSAGSAADGSRSRLPDVVTWVPTTLARRRQRGFDQAELLARAVARRLRVPCRRLLVRVGPMVAQTGRTAAERWAGPRFAVRGVCPARVLLVDDVVTTGATVSAAAAVLRSAGGTEVVVAAAARTRPGRFPAPVPPAAGVVSDTWP